MIDEEYNRLEIKGDGNKCTREILNELQVNISLRTIQGNANVYWNIPSKSNQSTKCEKKN